MPEIRAKSEAAQEMFALKRINKSSEKQQQLESAFSTFFDAFKAACGQLPSVLHTWLLKAAEPLHWRTIFSEKSFDEESFGKDLDNNQESKLKPSTSADYRSSHTHKHSRRPNAGELADTFSRYAHSLPGKASLIAPERHIAGSQTAYDFRELRTARRGVLAKFANADGNFPRNENKQEKSRLADETSRLPDE